MPVSSSLAIPRQGIDNANGPMVTLSGTISGATLPLTGWNVYIRNPDDGVPELKDQTATLNTGTGAYAFAARVAYGHEGNVYGEVRNGGGIIVANSNGRDVNDRDSP